MSPIYSKIVIRSVRRAVQSVATLFLLVTAVFLLSRVSGSPAVLYLPLGADAETIAKFNASHGFDRPLLEQFLGFLGDIARLDFGESLRRQASAMDIVLEAYPSTLRLAVATLVIGTALAATIGSLAALRPNSVTDRFLSVFSITGASLPDFWVALMGVLIFAIGLRWLPTSGVGPLPYWILPVGVLTIPIVGTLAQVVRGSMVEVLGSTYIKAARARGIPMHRVLFIHALKNAALPAVTVLGIQAAGILNGAVIVETIFGWPGVGKLMIASVLGRDFAVVQAAVVVTGVVILAVNILIDILYAFLDPRLSVA